MRIAINGLGRIGRNFLRILCADSTKKIEVVVINIGPARLDMIAHMFKYDSIMGTYPGNVHLEGETLHIDDKKIPIIAETDFAKLPWNSFKIDWVVDCSGRATKREVAQKHLDRGAHYVLISAPAHGEDVAIIPGVNDTLFDKTKHRIVSLGSCTTNALLPTVKVIHDAFVIKHGFMTTVHAYTNSQVLLDVESDDPRRSRAACLNMIPTTTGANEMIGKIIPELGPHFSGIALRVPVAIVSFLDITCTVQKATTQAQVNQSFERTSEQSLKNIIGVTYEPLVSSDFAGDPRSVIIDASLTNVQDTTIRVCGWYDNEWAYSMRLRDFLHKL